MNIKIIFLLILVLGGLKAKAEENNLTVSQKVARQKIQEKDLNKDGKLSVEEYFDSKYIEDNLKKRFERQDLNKDGILAKDELVEYSKKIWTQISKQPDAPPPWDSDLIATKQIKVEDQNKDQKITFEEYVQAHGQTFLKQNAKGFGKKDKNANGFLEEDEIL